MNKKSIKQNVLIFVFAVMGMSTPGLLLSILLSGNFHEIYTPKQFGKLMVYPENEEGRLVFLEGESKLFEVSTDEALDEQSIKVYGKNEAVICSFTRKADGDFKDVIFPQESSDEWALSENP